MPRGNIDNLIPNSQRTPEQLREMTKKGGVRSGEVRRAIKTFKQAFEEELDDNKIKSLIDAMYNKAKKGDTKAFELIRDTMGQKPVEQVQQIEAPKIVDDL